MTSDKIKDKFNYKAIINFLLSLVLAGFFLYIAFKDVDFSKVIQIALKANIFWVIVFILLIYLGHILRTFRWKIILSSVKPDIKFKNLFGALLVGYGVNCITPKLGEVTRAILLARLEKLSRSSMFGTIILERIIDVLSLIFSVLIGIYISTENIQKEFPWIMNAIYIAISIIFILIVLIALAFKFKNLFSIIIRKIIGNISTRAADKVIYISQMLVEGFISLKGRKNQIISILLSFSILIIYALTSYVGFLMLEMHKIQPINILMGWVIMSISSIGVIVPTPGSTGSYHALAKSALVFVYGFDETISAAYAFLTHIISYILMIISSLIIFLFSNRNKIFFKQSVEVLQEEVK